MNYGVTKEMSDRWMKKYIESLKQDKEFMEEVEKIANEIVDSKAEIFKEESEKSFMGMFTKGHSSVHLKPDGSIETVTDKYVIGFDPYRSDWSDEEIKGTFTVYKNGKPI